MKFIYYLILVLLFNSCNKEEVKLDPDYCKEIMLLVEDGTFICNKVGNYIFSGGKGHNKSSNSLLLYKFSDAKNHEIVEQMIYVFKSKSLFEKVNMSLIADRIIFDFLINENETFSYSLAISKYSIEKVKTKLEKLENHLISLEK